MSQEVTDFPRLELVSTIGFAGHIPGGLHVHPDRQHLIYPLGNTVVVEDLTSKQQCFLSGHTNNVSCIAVSKSGRFIASGQITHMGFKADVIVWDYPSMSEYCRLTLHKVKVEAVAFSPNDKYLVTLGGQDDGSIVLWDLAKKEAVCGSPAAVLSAGNSYALAFANNNDELFVSGGNKNLRVWRVDEANRKIRATDCNMGQLKRIIKCIKMDENDKYFYCGTTSGDILKVNVENHMFSTFGPDKDKFSLGVLVLQLVRCGEILVGAGDGTIAVVAVNDKFKKVKCLTLPKDAGAVSSLALRGQGHQFFVGTSTCQIHRVNYDDFKQELISTNHYKPVNDVVFPSGCNDVFITCSEETIRVWNLHTNKELLTIVVPNMVCNAVQVLHDGRAIISGWSDNKIRVFTPEKGKLMYAINDAHNKGVTAIAATSDCTKIISGGGEGQVRIWDICACKQRMIGAMKEHTGIVTCIQVMANDQECVTSSEDGTCIIWSLKTFVRSQVIFSNTLFKAVCSRPDILQVIATGTDRKISYWVTIDGSQIRELEGSKSGSIEGMDISPDGKFFVTGGKDKLVKVWKYDAGEVTHVGIGHAGDIARLKICPKQQWIVSVSADGAIMRWKFPFADELYAN